MFPLRMRPLAAVLLIFGCPLLIWNGFVQQLDAGWGDILARLRGPAETGRMKDTVLVAIDDATAARHGPLPLARSVLARGLERLADCGPRVLALDLLLAEPAAGDGELAAALGRFPRRVLAAALEAERERWVLPLPELRAGAAIGHVHASPDADGTVRQVNLETVAAGRRFWALGLEAARLGAGGGPPLETAAALQLATVRIPASGSGRPLRIRYAGPEGSFDRVPFSVLLDGTADASRFRGRTVIVGVTAQGGGDRLFTPFSSGIGMSGIEIHANIVRTIADGDFARPLPPVAELAACAAILGACLFALRRLRGARLAAALIAGAVALALACYAAPGWGWLLPPASFTVVYVAAVAVGGAAEYAALTGALRGEEEKRKASAFRMAAIAHELKTPLTAIQGSSELISAGLLPEPERVEMAGLIHKESKRLASMIQTFLDVERMAAGTLALERRPVDLAALCEETLERARLYATRKHTEIHAQVAQATIEADPDLLSFAIYNLLTNAVKYSPARSTVEMEARVDGGTATISVADRGYGIAPEEHARIFERFYRIERDRAGAESGAGIGLALVKEIVAQHGGRATVESRPGAGSRFTLTLPASTHA